MPNDLFPVYPHPDPHPHAWMCPPNFYRAGVGPLVATWNSFGGGWRVSAYAGTAGSLYSPAVFDTEEAALASLGYCRGPIVRQLEFDFAIP